MWTLYDSETGAVARYPLALGSWSGEARRRGSPTSQFKPTVQSDSLAGEIHVPSDPSWAGHTMKITIELTDARGNSLGDAVTDFLVPREPPDRDPYGAK
jgi:hypothetical protein